MYAGGKQGVIVAIRENIVAEIERKAGLTEVEIALNIFGRANAYQQRVNRHCRALLVEGKVVRHGKGGGADPYTYHLPPIKRRQL